MSIKFICSCGKHLRARDEMARRRSVCPRCGQPVGIPSREPTYPGTAAAPLTPAERLRLAAQRVATRAAESGTAAPPRPSAPPASPAGLPRDRVGTLMLALLAGRRAPGRQRQRPLETHWYEYLLYPFHDGRLWVGPAGLLTALSAVVLLLTPRLLALQAEGAVARWALASAGLLGLFAAGYPCNFLGCVLRSAACGDGSALRWVGHSVGGAMRAALVGLVCFLAGPVVPAAVAAAYWMQCGDPGLVDGLILAELAVLTVGYLLLALAAVSERGRLRDANPLSVIDLAHRLGWRAAAVALAGTVLALAHGLLAVVAAENLHREALVGLLLLAACWASGMFWATALFRLLGVWCYRSRPMPRTSVERRPEGGR
jgi:hypothetical protein